MAGEAAPLTKTHSLVSAALGATIDAVLPLPSAPFAGTVSAVTYTPNTTITGANTNTRTLSVTNKGAAGSGSTAVASLALVSGVNPAADVEQALTLSGTAANLVVAAGDVLVFNSTHAGTGIADPGGEVTVTFTRVAGA